MKLPKPIIKFNGGNPIALCNRCFCIMCYVACANNDIEDKCVVVERKSVGGIDLIDTGIGKDVPPFCSVCSNLLLNYSLNE